MMFEACPLSGDDLKIRLADLRGLLSGAVVRERSGDVAVFRFGRHDALRLRDLTEREATCCGFWRFDIRDEGDEVVLSVGVEASRFRHFVDRFYELGSSSRVGGPPAPSQLTTPAIASGRGRR
jgi:hypothetical protein